MPYEAENTAEAAHELIREEVEKELPKPEWVGRVALSTMVMALLAALSSMLSGITSNALVVETADEILVDEHLETVRQDVEILKSKHDILRALGHMPAASELKKIRKYQEEIPNLERRRQADEEQVKNTMHEHEMFAIAVTLLSVGITLNGIALLARHRFVWGLGGVVGIGGMLLMSLGILKILTI